MKLNQRFLLSILISGVFFTLLLIINLQIFVVKEHRLLPSYGRIQGREQNYGNSFKKRFLQKSPNGSRETSAAMSAPNKVDNTASEEAATGAGGGKGGHPPPKEEQEDFVDLVEAVMSVIKKQAVLEKVRKNHDSWKKRENPTLEEMLRLRHRKNLTNWERFHRRITQNELYREKDIVVDSLLKQMATEPILHISQKDGGTQLKLIIDYPKHGHALFKPMRFPREQQTLPNHFYFTDFERHNAEIAAFHLDRLLGFRRAPPVSGRILNMTNDLYRLAEGDLLKTFFISPANNICFHGKCSYYCDTAHAICGNPDMLEGAFAVFLPPKEMASRKIWRHPWRRSYHKRRKAQWELDPDYCDLVRDIPPYNSGRRLMDIMDMSVLDFLIGNMDRHHYETFRVFGNETFPVHLDHGRGFGRPFHDELSILAPIHQCCLIRLSTLTKLMNFHLGPHRLSTLMKASLSRDPINPVLWAPHFDALDRRVKIILRVVRDCLQKSDAYSDVIIHDDGT